MIQKKGFGFFLNVGGDKNFDRKSTDFGRKYLHMTFTMSQAENTENTESSWNLFDEKCFYSIFCGENDEKTLDVGFLTVFGKYFWRKSPKDDDKFHSDFRPRKKLHVGV